MSRAVPRAARGSLSWPHDGHEQLGSSESQLSRPSDRPTAVGATSDLEPGWTRRRAPRVRARWRPDSATSHSSGAAVRRGGFDGQLDGGLCGIGRLDADAPGVAAVVVGEAQHAPAREHENQFAALGSGKTGRADQRVRVRRASCSTTVASGWNGEMVGDSAVATVSSPKLPSERSAKPNRTVLDAVDVAEVRGIPGDPPEAQREPDRVDDRARLGPRVRGGRTSCRSRSSAVRP